jgi:hypothetical protein
VIFWADEGRERSRNRSLRELLAGRRSVT